MNLFFKKSAGFLFDFNYFTRMQSQGSFKIFIPAFAAKLSVIISNDLIIDDYCKRYLDHLLLHSKYYLTIYAQVLDKAMQHAEKPTYEINLVDFGAGNGLLGIFAKYCGFKKVFLCDSDADFVKAAEVMGDALSIFIDGMITGDIDQLKNIVQNETIDIIVGTDVIEHIYNLDDFFEGVRKINNRMVTVFTTASNPSNFLKVRKLKKLQVKDEYEGGDPTDFVLAGSKKHEAFIVMREKIILTAFPLIPSATLKQLAALTRGSKKTDILLAVEHYLASGKMPVNKGITSNTCNPITGSWTERILPIAIYNNIYTKNHFDMEVHNGFYNAYSKGNKKYFNLCMNFLVRLTGKIIAPYITLIGYKKG